MKIMDIFEDPGKNELYTTLMWLRNHYDVGRRELRQRVLEQVDDVLNRTRGSDETA